MTDHEIDRELYRMRTGTGDSCSETVTDMFRRRRREEAIYERDIKIALEDKPEWRDW